MKKIVNIILIMLYITFAVSCAKSNAEINVPTPDYSISGKIMYPNSIPIINVAIDVSGEGINKDDITDATGSYRISDLHTGDYDIHIEEEDNRTGFDGNVNIGQNDKEFNVLLGIKSINVAHIEGNDNIGQKCYFKFSFENFYLGNNFHLLSSLYFRLQGEYTQSNVQDFYIFKMPLEASFTDIEINLENYTCSYNGAELDLLWHFDALSSCTVTFDNINEISEFLSYTNGFIALDNNHATGSLIHLADVKAYYTF